MIYCIYNQYLMAILVKEISDIFASAGIKKEKADELAVVVDKHYVRKDAHDLATKGDIDALKEEMSALKIELRRLEVRMISWVVGTVLVATAISIWVG